MNEPQKNLLELLIEFDELCHSHDITYYLGGGTALGAVRHHGFLFWDDDVDLYMTRKNWERLRAIAEQILPDNRALIHVGNTPYYFNIIPRYVNQLTSQFYKTQIICGQSCGQHLEILIFDPLPVEPREVTNYKKLLLVYTELLSPYFVVNRQIINEDSCFDKQLYKKYYRMSKVIGREKVLKKLEDKLLHYSDEECQTYCMRWGLMLLLYNKSSFGEPRYETFEGHKLPVAEHAEEIFRTAYGDDWMYIPISSEQVVHNAIRDYETPLKVYYEDYIPHLDRDKALKAYKSNKRINLRILRQKEQTNKNIYQLQALAVKLELKPELQQKLPKLEQLLLQKRYTELKKNFESYYQVQLAGIMRKNRILIIQDLRLIYLSAAALVYTGEYYNARKLLNLIKSLNMTLSGELEKLDQLISLLRELSVAVYDHQDTALTQQLLETGSQQYGWLLDFRRYQLWAEARSSDKNKTADWQQLQDKAEQALSEYPDDPECLKYLADAWWGMGKQEEAKELYYRVLQNSRNGILLLDINDKTGLCFMEADAKTDSDNDSFLE